MYITCQMVHTISKSINVHETERCFMFSMHNSSLLANGTYRNRFYLYMKIFVRKLCQHWDIKHHKTILMSEYWDSLITEYSCWEWIYFHSPATLRHQPILLLMLLHVKRTSDMERRNHKWTYCRGIHLTMYIVACTVTIRAFWCWQTI